MITPVEIQSKSFKSGGLGYDKKDVDTFMKDILTSYEELYRENMELKDKVSVLDEGIQYYKSIEKTLQKALMLAEKTAEETKTAAQKEAKRIEKEAGVKANIMLADARNELEQLHQRTVTLIQQYEKYKVQFKNLAAAQIELLETDAFNINIQKLDAFSEVGYTDFSSNKDSVRETGEVREIVSGSESITSGGHLSDEEADEFDFSDIELEGQEEFDFLNINDQ